ncbi:putative O-glycosylation ligase, exosortase A system-associated [Azohydromonas sediminis]|uniref:putative O-glycosylation ligase, exosortase A system-associated n=1 Tax=Azohydromonas sediminis TaxID=2259674 RepID=UPI000E65B83B|nr:putative O-glycosylation ligase, exosortase A system-associated [Azohydromonas sediminis]
MRDLVLACVVFGALPFIFKRPFLGILMMAWLGYMNPHRLAWGFMVDMPVVFIVAVVTLTGMLFSKEPKRIVWSREIVLLAIFILWMGITTTQALYFDAAVAQYEKVVKIQILTFMTLLMLTSRERVNLLIWVIVLSLAFYGIKGGLFTIAKGGVYRVQGPQGTFIGGNNELALAMVMTIPLMRYLQLQEKRQLVKLGLTMGMLLTAIAAFGTQSRGALVALICTGAIFWLKSRKKIVTAVLIIAAGLIGVNLMPEAWFERMSTIKTFDEDRSALGRISAWWTAFNLANDRFFGGGFELWRWDVFAKYSPTPEFVHDVHSIYFEVLGEHGWVGLILFLSLLGLTWLKCNSLIRYGKKHTDEMWTKDLGAMVQVSMVAYLTAGAFLGLAYFDYIYHLIAIVVVVHHMVVTKPSQRFELAGGMRGVSVPDVPARASQ